MRDTLRRMKFQLECVASPRLRRLYEAEPDRLLLEEYRWRIGHGPFTGMRYIDRASGSRLAPKIAGCYEREIHHCIDHILNTRYDVIYDIGAAEGYYAVGLAWRMKALGKRTQIEAYDCDSRARADLEALAVLNGVEDHILLGDFCRASDLQRHAGKRVFVLCDIEGAETTVLDPNRAPALRGYDLLVEIHDAPEQTATRQFFERSFGKTHHITRIHAQPRTDDDFARITWTRNRTVQERALDEGRVYGTEWMFLQSHA